MFTLFDPNYWLIVGPALLLGAWASWRVKSAFARYSRVAVRSGMTGAEAAAQVARAGGADIQIQRVSGFLSDHYDPSSRTLRLSPDVYDGHSISAVAVGAHEAGHALQHKAGYAALKMRTGLVPILTIGSHAWMWLFLLGMIMRAAPLMLAGIAILALIVVFQIITLPVEFNASARAKEVLASTGIVSTQEEARGVETVLSAAALTYVAGTLTAIATLIYYLSLFSGMQRRD
jgi:Zn-dependent membrane protease YugP